MNVFLSVDIVLMFSNGLIRNVCCILVQPLLTITLLIKDDNHKMEPPGP